jgi:TorA maturation chaperone TorD
MTHFSQRDNFSTAARVLGALFYYAPDSGSFGTGQCVKQRWLAGAVAAWKTTLSPLVAQFQAEADELSRGLAASVCRPLCAPAPPWGSVWLDRENVLFGDSTLALRQWMRDNGIQFAMQQNEPEDHFGSLLLLTAWLAENATPSANSCWPGICSRGHRFLNVFIEKADHPFYQALGELARLTLAQWQSQLLIPVADKPLFR